MVKKEIGSEFEPRITTNIKGRTPLTNDERRLKYFKKNKSILDKARKNPDKEFVMDMLPDNSYSQGSVRTRVTKLREVFSDTGYKFRSTYAEGAEGYVYLLIKYENEGMAHEEEQ